MFIYFISHLRDVVDLISRDRGGCEGVIVRTVSQYFAILKINNETQVNHL